MSRSLFRQDTQMWNSGAAADYDDTVAAGSGLETSAATMLDDLNALRSQMSRILDAAAGNWYDDVPTVNTKKRGLQQLNTDLDDIEIKPLLYHTTVVSADVTVGNGNNFVILSVSGSEAPSQVAAVGAVTTEGAVVVQHSGTFGTHSLDELAGTSQLLPKTICEVRDASTGQRLQSSGRDIFALIQTEVATNGHTFNDTNQRVQLSFVRYTAGLDDLEACPVADIEDEVVNYSYPIRVHFDNIPEDAYLSGGFIDLSASVDVTLSNAIANQSGIANQAKDIQWNVVDTYSLSFTSDSGGTNIIDISAEAAGDTVTMNGDLDVNTTLAADFNQGVKVDTSGTTISIGDTAGEISSAGALKVASGGAADIEIEGANEVLFDDVNRSGWTATSVKLSEDAASWTNYKTAYGEVSLMDAIYQAGSSGTTRDKKVGYVTAVGGINADTNVTGAGGTPNLSTQLGDYSSVTFTTDVDVYVNGQLQWNGADAAANNDVYPGDSAANGDLKFEYKLKQNDVVTMIVWS